MESMLLSELISAVGGEFLLGDPCTRITSISLDTRTMRKGEVFFALAGRNFDAHAFIKDAVEKQASVLVVSRLDIDLGNPFPAVPAVIRVPDTTKALADLARHYRKKWDIPFVAVTGSNGKTTTKDMIAAILRQKFVTLSTEGNYNNQIGLPLTLLNLTAAHQCAIVELGTSAPGEIGALADIVNPTVGVITNVGPGHLEFFGSLDGVFEEKKTLLGKLAPGGWGVINVDDPYLARRDAYGTANILTFGIENDADVMARGLKLWPDKPRFELHAGKAAVTVTLPVYGRFNVYNALAAAAAATRLGVDLELIKKGLESFIPPPMRMEVHKLVSGGIVINDAYNANPASMREAVLAMVQAFPDRDKIVVLADMLELGQAAEREHAALGEFLAAQPLSGILLYGPLMQRTFAAARGLPVRYFERQDDLQLELKKYHAADKVILFKGSRGMHLEETVEELVGRSGAGSRFTA